MSVKIFDELSAMQAQYTPFALRYLQSGSKLSIITMVAFVLCWGPMALGLEVIYTEPLTPCHETYTAFVASVAVAAPMFIDLAIDMLLSYRLPHYDARKVKSPRTILILSLLLPDLCVLCISMPLMNLSLLLCLFKSRSVLLIYGIYGHLWQLDSFFRCRLFLLSYLLITTSFVLGAYTGFYPISESIDMYSFTWTYGYVGAAGLLTFLPFAFQWTKKMRNISYKKMTSNEMSASAALCLSQLYKVELFKMKFKSKKIYLI
eukprot:gene488-916_t